MTTHGGKRINSGRPKGLGKYKEVTRPIRIPLSRINDVIQFLEQSPTLIPLYSCRVRAGFPSPADDYIESYLDLNEHLVAHPGATFFVRASGNSMIDAGIYDGDLLVVDKSLTPTHGRIVIAAVNGELTVKRLSITKAGIQLIAENKQYPALTISEELDMVVWGVVIHSIKSVF